MENIGIKFNFVCINVEVMCCHFEDIIYLFYLKRDKNTYRYSQEFVYVTRARSRTLESVPGDSDGAYI